MTLITRLQPPPFIFAYMQIPLSLEHLTLLEAARSWYFSPNRKKNPWKQNLHHNIVRVYPHFTTILPSDSSSFKPFCWSNSFYANLFGPSLTILEPQILKLFLIGITLKAHMLCGILSVQNKNPLHLYLMIRNPMLLPFRCPIPWMNGKFYLK